MSKLRIAIGVALALSVLASAEAHAAKFRPELEVESADKGPYPWNYEEIMARSFYDPESVRVSDAAKPVAGWWTIPWMETNSVKSNKRGRTKFGWMVFARINAKNKLGGYVGAKCYKFLIRSGAVFRYAECRSVTSTQRAEGEQEYEKQWAALDAETRAQIESKLAGEETAEEPNGPDYVEELRALKALLDEGIITQQEFEAKKSEILGDS